jgi:hypothetical protein
MSFKTTIKKVPFAKNAYSVWRAFMAFAGSVPNRFFFIRDFRKFNSLTANKRFSNNWTDHSAVLFEKTSQTEFDRHYVYHTAWAARCLAETKPAKHVDISSSLYFTALCSAFIEMEFYDFRPANLILNNLTCASANLNALHMKSGSIGSLSCMHTVEHIGLGRYGDEIDPDGDLKAMAELERVLAPGGNLFFVVPIGEPKIVFNSHRIYSYEQIIHYFKALNLHRFTFIGENFSDGGLINNPPPELLAGQKYGCGCFWFKKGFPA